MEVVAKKISKISTGNPEKLSSGSFFKPAPALVPQTSISNRSNFFKPAIQTSKTIDTVAQTEAPVTTNKITVAPAPALNKPAEIVPVAQPVAENNIQQTEQTTGTNQEQSVNGKNKINAGEQDVAAAPVNKSNAIQLDGKATPAAEAKEGDAEAKPGLRFINPAATEKVFKGKIAKAGKLAKITATTKTAKAKIEESEKAQDKPEAEQHSDSNHGQVAGYAGQPVAEKSKAESQNALKNAIEEVMPKSLGDVRDFKNKGKAKHISNAVSSQVKGDVGSVKSSFGGMAKTPAAAPAEKGTGLPLPEEAAEVEQLNMGAGVIPKIEPQHLDTTDYLKQNDDLLKKEELPQEHLDMVDSGDLAEANKQRTQLKADAAEQPKEIQETAATEHKQLNADMHAEEKHGRQAMAKHRGGKLKDTGDKQKATKTKLEKEREDVAKLINGKYETCQKSIISKLDALEKDSLARFDRGQAKATTDFENQVNNDIDEFKRKRYDEVGWARRKYRQARDWLLGIDDFPEVEKAFSDARKAFETTIDKLISDITADNNKVIAECKTQLQTTKEEIAGIVEKLKPALKSAGDLAMKEVEKKLDELNADIDKRKEKMQQQLADKRQAAMKAIDAKIEKMKEKLSGALSAIGKLLLEALKKFFKWALEKLGIDAEGFFNTLSKIGTAIKAMFKSPGKFFSNLIAAVKGAISDFKTNFKTYLTGALFDWLTGSIGSVVTLPKVFDVKGVLSMIMQVAGISWSFIRSKLVNIFGEQKVAYAEKTVAVVKKFVDEGIMGIWDWIKNSAQSLMSTMIDSIKEWLLTKLVISFAEWIASLLIPGGAILRLVQGIYKLIMWFIDNIQRILRWVNAVLDGMVSIASGAIAGAIGFIVGGMKLIIPAILDFFAKLLNISGIVDAVKNIINKIVGPIHAAIDKMVDWLKGVLNKVVDKVKGAFSKKEEKKSAEGNIDPEKQKALDSAIAEAEALLADEEMSEEDVTLKLPDIKKKYQLAELKLVIDQDGAEEDTVHVHGEINPQKDTGRIKKRKKVKKGTLIQIMDSGKWSEYSLKVTKVVNQHKFYAKAKSQNEEVFENKQLDITWRKFNPYKTGEAWEAIIDGSEWSNYGDARQVLNYRKHKQFQNPPAKDWHHIVEQSNKTNTEHSVVNLAIVDENLNRGFLNQYYDKQYPETGGLSLRDWLNTTQTKEVARYWGLRAINAMGKSIITKNDTRGKFQEIE